MTCANCSAATTGAYCAACGQRTDVRRLAVRELLGRFFGELTGYERPLLATVRGLATAPGRVAAEYAAGRRTRYANPVKWAIATTALAFLVTRQIAGGAFKISTGNANDTPAWLHSLLEIVASNAAPLFVLVLLPVLALAMQLCFRGTGRTFAEELVLVLYAYGFAVLLQLGCAAFTATTGIGTPFSGMLPPAWTAFGAVAFHPACRGWSSVLRTIAAHTLWILMLVGVTLLITGLLELLGVLT